MSQTEAAQALGITSAALSQYEKGKRRVEALLLEELSQLYGVPLGYFFCHERLAIDWEVALRSMSKDLSSEGKAGISYLIKKVHLLEELYRLTETPFPTSPHPPFAALKEEKLSDYEVAEYAQKARRHFELGLAPILDLQGFLEAQGYKTFAVPLGKEKDDLSGFFFMHASLGPIVAMNEDQAYSRQPFTLAHELAHGLYHYDRPSILCRANDFRQLEQFAERFARRHGAADDIGIRHDSDQLLALLHQQRADPRRAHRFGSADNGSLRPDGFRTFRHDLCNGGHHALLSKW